nr:hypothetical protein [Bacillus paranthracis]
VYWGEFYKRHVCIVKSPTDISPYPFVIIIGYLIALLTIWPINILEKEKNCLYYIFFLLQL